MVKWIDVPKLLSRVNLITPTVPKAEKMSFFRNRRCQHLTQKPFLISIWGGKKHLGYLLYSKFHWLREVCFSGTVWIGRLSEVVGSWPTYNWQFGFEHFSILFLSQVKFKFNLAPLNDLIWTGWKQLLPW